MGAAESLSLAITTQTTGCREFGLAGYGVRADRARRCLANPNGPNTKLKVTFFWPFSGNYWIIDLDPGYRWAVVGEPGRNYLWILSREPRLDETLYDRIVESAKRQGYAVERLVKTAQSL